MEEENIMQVIKKTGISCQKKEYYIRGYYKIDGKNTRSKYIIRS